jgi:hypothetical protein
MLATGTMMKFNSVKVKKMSGDTFKYHFGPFFHSMKTKNVILVAEIILKAKIVLSCTFRKPMFVLFG